MKNYLPTRRVARDSAAMSGSVVVVGSLGLAGLQYIAARHGMQAADRAKGMDGIGVAAGYLAGEVAMTLGALLIATRALGAKHWILAGMVVAVGDLGLLALLFRHIAGEDQQRWPGAAAFTAALALPAVVVWRVTRRGVVT